MSEYPVDDDLQEWAERDFDHGYPCSPLTEILPFFKPGESRFRPRYSMRPCDISRSIEVRSMLPIGVLHFPTSSPISHFPYPGHHDFR